MLQHAAIRQETVIPEGVSLGWRHFRDNRAAGSMVPGDVDESKAGADPALWRPEGRCYGALRMLYGPQVMEKVFGKDR